MIADHYKVYKYNGKRKNGVWYRNNIVARFKTFEDAYKFLQDNPFELYFGTWMNVPTDACSTFIWSERDYFNEDGTINMELLKEDTIENFPNLITCQK